MASGVSREIHSLSRVVALVTGAASGLGRAAAARLARQARDITCTLHSANFLSPGGVSGCSRST